MENINPASDKKSLRRGFSTGANAAAAALLAVQHYMGHNKGKEIAVNLPMGQGIKFHALEIGTENNASFAILQKDAGDDPDVTHQALIKVVAKPLKHSLPPALGKIAVTHNHFILELTRGQGVGLVTKLGLPIAVGAPAISQKPKTYISQNIFNFLQQQPHTPHYWQLQFSIEKGQILAKQTLNPRLGILDGLSILGTTGAVIPYSCAAWIDSIHRSIDVAMAYQQEHLFAATGSESEQLLRHQFQPNEEAIIDMGDFVGAMFKYLKKKKFIGKITLAGGPGKLLKLAQGHNDLHSGRSNANMPKLAQDFAFMLKRYGTPVQDLENQLQQIKTATSMGYVLTILPADLRSLLCQMILRQCYQYLKTEFNINQLTLYMVARGGDLLAEYSG